VPAAFLHDAHHWLILHGRYVCKARAPACPTCVIADLCEYRDKTPPPGDAPTGRAKSTARRGSRER
jgi:endonuclease-3